MKKAIPQYFETEIIYMTSGVSSEALSDWVFNIQRPIKIANTSYSAKGHAEIAVAFSSYRKWIPCPNNTI